MLGCLLDGLPFKTFTFRHNKKTNIVEFKINSICSCKLLFLRNVFGGLQGQAAQQKSKKANIGLLPWIYSGSMDLYSFGRKIFELHADPLST